MAKRTIQKKDLSGSKLYIFKDWIVDESGSFIYEVCVNRYWKNGFSIIDRQLFKSDKFLNISKFREFNKEKNAIFEKCTTLLSVPKEFILNNNLSEYIPKCAKRSK